MSSSRPTGSPLTSRKTVVARHPRRLLPSPTRGSRLSRRSAALSLMVGWASSRKAPDCGLAMAASRSPRSLAGPMPRPCTRPRRSSRVRFSTPVTQSRVGRARHPTAPLCDGTFLAWPRPLTTVENCPPDDLLTRQPLFLDKLIEGSLQCLAGAVADWERISG